MMLGLGVPGLGFGGLGLGSAIAGETLAAEATEVRLTDNGKSTTFELVMDKGVPAQVFTLANPYRVIIDLPDLAFGLDPSLGQHGRGLVSAFRYGLFAEHKSRVVIDTTGPVKIASASMTRVGGSKAIKLAVVLVPIDAAAFGTGTGPGRTAASSSSPEASAEGARAANLEAKRKAHGKPVVVIDAGHGGIDPGAMGANNVSEKTIVLAVAQQLKAALDKTGLYEVKMTRTEDVFVSLDRRLKFSYDNAADLFVSLHADSIEEKVAGSVRGATIYTLSGQASDEQARIMAEKENASDLIAGIDTADHGGNDQVKSILIDLLKRETSNFSADFSQVLAKRLGKTIAMSRVPRRSAAFKVLKQTHAPSVLVELGYMSNQSDEAQMLTLDWQQKVAASIAGAVQIYFSKRTAEQP
jgi:N-acetylmuramoyl-L-alanine amidase